MERRTMYIIPAVVHGWRYKETTQILLKFRSMMSITDSAFPHFCRHPYANVQRLEEQA